MHLNRPVVGMAVDASGGGYWLVATDGGIFSFGDAEFHGSTGGMHLNQAGRRHVGRRPTATATGWWPPTAGSSPSATPSSTARTGGMVLNRPIIGMAVDSSGNGYWLVASDGGHLLLR